MEKYLDLARLGKNEWWRTVLAVALMLFMWQLLGALPAVLLTINAIQQPGFQPGSASHGFPGAETLAGFLAIMLASVFFAAGIYLSMRFIHQRSWRTLVTPEKSINAKRLGQGFAAWFVLAALISVVEALLYPGRYVWQWQMGHFLPYAILALVFIPIQTTAEELFFRGYILQGFGLRSRNTWLLCSLSGLLFGLPHLLNPEASTNYSLLGFFYFAFGFFLAFITLRDGRLELALGAHAANNLFSVLIANYTVSVLPSPSIFSIKTLDAGYSVVSAICAMGIFVCLFFWPWKKKEREEKGLG